MPAFADLIILPKIQLLLSLYFCKQNIVGKQLCLVYIDPCLIYQYENYAVSRQQNKEISTQESGGRNKYLL